MSEGSLEDALAAAGGPIDLLRNADAGTVGFPDVPAEWTHWIEEQRAWRETCSFADQSHHMTDLRVEGPDALSVFADLGTNRFEGFRPGEAKQFVACNPKGYLIGDGILLHLEEDRLDLVGLPPAANWVQYHLETGDYDATVQRDDSSAVRDGPPANFRYQIQGPNARSVVEAATDEPLPEIPFFGFAELAVDGRPFYALRHGMAGEPGFEFWGPWEDGEAIEDAVLDAGEAQGIRRLGWKSYASSAVVSGWVGSPLPAVYHGDDLAAYRRWLDADGFEANCSLGGSLEAEAVSAYYVRPWEVGYERLVSFDRDYVGRAALEAAHAEPGRTLVTLVWDGADTADAFGSLFRDGETAKYVDLPRVRWATSHHDAVTRNGEVVGMTETCSYNYNERAILALAVVEEAHAEPGTEVMVRWGEAGEPIHPRVERHAQTEIAATVATVPYVEDRR